MAAQPKPRPIDARLRELTIFGAGLAVASAAFLGYLVFAAPVFSSRATTAPARATPAPIVVQVAGAVVNPGLYPLTASSRVDDALRAAGGPTDDADMAQVNLAARITDGQRITIPRLTAGADADPSLTVARSASTPKPQARSELVNVNTASFADLDALPGVGPVTAQKVMEQRAKAPFTSLDQLVDLKIMNAATLERLRDQLTVD
jgi:competence protein ComEA